MNDDATKFLIERIDCEQCWTCTGVGAKNRLVHEILRSYNLRSLNVWRIETEPDVYELEFTILKNGKMP